MGGSKKKLTEEELKLIEEAELFMQEVYSDPDVAEAEPPANLRDKVFAEIRSREAIRREHEKENHKPEEHDMLLLVRVYKRKLRMQRYVMLAAILILVMAFGVTSIGGPEKVLEKITYVLTGHEQVSIDSKNENVVPIKTMDEEETYQKIEEKFGFIPVTPYYLPNETKFIEAELGEAIQCINIIYGKEENVKITYLLRPHYRASSHGKDVEDDFVEEYIKENGYATIYIRRYLVDQKEERWTVQFEYKEVLYTMTIMDTSKAEVEKIVENLFFS